MKSNLVGLRSFGRVWRLGTLGDDWMFLPLTCCAASIIGNTPVTISGAYDVFTGAVAFMPAVYPARMPPSTPCPLPIMFPEISLSAVLLAPGATFSPEAQAGLGQD